MRSSRTFGQEVRGADVVEKWIQAPNLSQFFERQILDTNDYDFGIGERSPLYPITEIYRARMLMAVTQGWGGDWREGENLRRRFDMIRKIFEKAAEAYPENRIIRMYLGKPIPPDKQYYAVPGAPEWAVFQREALERWSDIIEWWIDHRMQDDGPPYIRFRMTAAREDITPALHNTAEALRVNFEGYTSEVRYTDRLIRFPSLFKENGIYPDPIVAIREPDTNLLYSAVTGDPGNAGWFPLNAVRWLTPARNIAALVTHASRDRFEAELFHFGADPRPMAAELYLLEHGRYRVHISSEGSSEPNVEHEKTLDILGRRGRLEFVLPARRLCLLKIHRDTGN